MPGERPTRFRGLSAGYHEKTFATFDLKAAPLMRAAYDQCLAVAEGKLPWALLQGTYGTGKTHLAIAALLLWTEREHSGYFWKVPDFLAFLRAGLNDNAYYNTEQRVDSYRTGSGLVIFDDLGTENRTEWAVEQLYRVLDSRYESSLPTIITTNVEPDRLDPRVLSRYRRSLVVCQGRDMRGAKD